MVVVVSDGVVEGCGAGEMAAGEGHEGVEEDGTGEGALGDIDGEVAGNVGYVELIVEVSASARAREEREGERVEGGFCFCCCCCWGGGGWGVRRRRTSAARCSI